ncbi:MAG: hypothetical protein A2857_00640 [Candidatus Levybacteria bacterium RIFCSPHIGHO2_01_FULL_36_15]|nr:MAG: hypothetical protein A2857_00640 [Candidatus Levybacteria bacterium RIFCSPHIGHO2_01_FULL_36_15]
MPFYENNIGKIVGKKPLGFVPYERQVRVLNIDENKFTKRTKVPLWGWILLIILAFFVSLIPAVPIGSPLTDNSATGVGGSPNDIFNKKIVLSSIPVKNQLTDRSFWISLSNKQTLLVILEKGKILKDTLGHKMAVVDGDLVDLTGMVKKVDSVDKIKSELGLSSAEVSALLDQPIYFLVSRAEISQE